MRRATLAAATARLRALWTRRRLDREARDEFRAHLDLLATRYVQQGMTPADAQAAARRQFGNLALVEEDVSRLNGVRWIDGLVRDLSYAFRQIRRGPGFAAVVIATLALGVGGTTAVFSVVRAVLLAPLPYDESDRLVRLYQQEPGKPDTRGVVAGTHFTFVRDQVLSFEGTAALANYSEVGRDLVVDGQPRRLRVLPVTSDYFRTLRAALRGPGFDRRDETGTRRVVLSDGLWRRAFRASPDVIGSTVRLSAEPYEIAGIAPAGFEDAIAGPVDAWIPYNLAGDTMSFNTSLDAIARLRPGVGLDRVEAELAVLNAAMRERWPEARLSALAAVPLHGDLVDDARGPLQLFLIAAGLVLLVACVNVANLMLVRASGRTHEFAVRSALGSGRTRLARQLIVESLVLAAAGGLVGLALADLGVRALEAIGRDAVPRIDAVGFDSTVLSFALLATLLTSAAFGLIPALRLSSASPTDVLRRQSRGATASRRQSWLRSGLATTQLAMALMLLSGAGVLLASVVRLGQVNLGFQADRVLTFEINLPGARYNAVRRAAFSEELARELEGIPGVTAAGGISRLPGTGSFHPWNTHLRSGPLAGTAVRSADGDNMQQRVISGSVFRALGIPVLAGRTFDVRDDVSAPMRAVVSAGFARRAFPGLPLDGALGQQISAGGRDLTIVGVVGDTVLNAYGAPSLVVYHAHRQFAARNWALMHVVAMDGDPSAALSAVRARVAALDPELVAHRPAPLSDVIGRGASRQRFAFLLIGTFAAVSVLVASIGLYGVLAYAVRQRTREIGIRMALGATAGQVRGLVLGQAALVIGAGLVFGLGGALGLGHWLTLLAFQVSPWDVRILGATAGALTVAAVLAAWLPARRAARVSPTVAIQES